jgi:hypothetical protein
MLLPYSMYVCALTGLNSTWCHMQQTTCSIKCHVRHASDTNTTCARNKKNDPNSTISSAPQTAVRASAAPARSTTYGL